IRSGKSETRSRSAARAPAQDQGLRELSQAVGPARSRLLFGAHALDCATRICGFDQICLPESRELYADVRVHGESPLLSIDLPARKDSDRPGLFRPRYRGNMFGPFGVLHGVSTVCVPSPASEISSFSPC